MGNSLKSLYLKIHQKKKVWGLLFISIIVAIIRTAVGYLYTPLINGYIDNNNFSSVSTISVIILLGYSLIWCLTFLIKKYSLILQKDEEAYHIDIIIQTMSLQNQLDIQRLNIGGWMALLTTDITNMTSFGFSTLISFIGGIITFMGALSFGMLTSPLLTIVILCLSYVAVFIPQRISKYIEKYRLNQHTSNEQLQTTVLQLMRESMLLRIFDAVDLGVNHFKSEYQHYNESELQTKRYSILMISLSVMSGFLFTVVWVSVALVLIKMGNLSIGNFVTFTVLNNSFAWCFFELPSIYQGFLEQKISYDRLEKFTISQKVDSLNQLTETDLEYLEYKNIMFRYPSQTIATLNNVSLDINVTQQEKIALIGQSGSGKSTICQLIIGNISPLEGKIIFNRHQNISAQSVSSFVSIMPQSNIIFSATIRENILLGQKIDEDTLWRIIKTAGLDELLEKLEKGINTSIESGEQLILSEGERQRICFARMLVKDANIYVLDEPTASLDSSNEQRILEFIRTTKASVVLVTHRTDTVPIGMRILELKKGVSVYEDS